ncbi:MAG: hypothetical protein EOO68_38745 [Moraxellaceae bacterium]|nr:MAG: hypothetical protein EOO68_38745 [Moraxellaceae bacterium]
MHCVTAASSTSSRLEEAIAVELAAHDSNKTWIEVERPANARILTTKWVFALKRDKQGNIERHKARLVARGFEQRPGVDFYQTFAPVAKLESVRALLAICAIKNMSMTQFDIRVYP